MPRTEIPRRTSYKRFPASVAHENSLIYTDPQSRPPPPPRFFLSRAAPPLEILFAMLSRFLLRQNKSAPSSAGPACPRSTKIHSNRRALSRNRCVPECRSSLSPIFPVVRHFPPV